MKTTRRGAILLGLAGAGAMVAGCVPGMGAPAMIRGSGRVASEVRNVADFHEVAVSGSGTLLVRQTGAESLTVEAEDNILPYLRSEVRNGRLSLGVAENVGISTTKPIRYTLTVKDLRALDLSGSTKAEVEGLRAPELRVGISGSGNVKLSGHADRQEVRISGSGDYVADGLDSKEVTLRTSGSSYAAVRVSDRLNVTVSGSGRVEYFGNPVISQSITGSGSIQKR
jgi:hypothetical protein